MTVHRIINICALVLFALDMVWFLIRLIKNGKPEPSEEKGFVLREILIYITALVIIGLCFFIDFGLMANIILNACAILAAEIANRQWFGY